jgi:hypothetical protein
LNVDDAMLAAGRSNEVLFREIMRVAVGDLVLNVLDDPDEVVEGNSILVIERLNLFTLTSGLLSEL